jgi:ParB/RepB/Spo0J family partition protein
MQDHGLLQPITVEEVDDGFQLIAGEQRVRAAKLAGWTSIDALVVPKMTELKASVMGMLENQQRKNLNPIEIARGYQKLIGRFDLSHAQVGSLLGVSKTVVTRSLALLELSAEIQQGLERGDLSPGHIRALEHIESEEERAALLKQAAAERWSTREIQSRARRTPTRPTATQGTAEPHPASGLQSSAATRGNAEPNTATVQTDPLVTVGKTDSHPTAGPTHPAATLGKAKPHPVPGLTLQVLEKWVLEAAVHFLGKLVEWLIRVWVRLRPGSRTALALHFKQDLPPANPMDSEKKPPEAGAA